MRHKKKRKIKAGKMEVGWKERPAESAARSKKENSFPLRLPEAVPHESSISLTRPSTRQRRGQETSPWHFPTRTQETTKRKEEEKNSKSHAVHYFMNVSLPACTCSSRGHAGKLEDEWMSGSTGEEIGSENGLDKRPTFPSVKRSNGTYRGHEGDDETGQTETQLKPRRDGRQD